MFAVKMQDNTTNRNNSLSVRLQEIGDRAHRIGQGQTSPPTYHVETREGRTVIVRSGAEKSSKSK